MSEFVLSCCSTADLSSDHFAARDIQYVPFHFHLNGKEYDDDLGQSISYPEFYAAMAAGGETSTSQVNVREYLNHFEKFLSEGKDVLHVCLSSGISGTYQSAVNAARIAQEAERLLFTTFGENCKYLYDVIYYILNRNK